MGKKRANKVQSLKPNDSFQNVVNKAVRSNMQQFVLEQIQRVGQGLARELNGSLEDIYARLTTLEEVVLKQVGMTADEFAGLVANTEDQAAGLELVETGNVEKDDVVRLEVETKTEDQKEYQGSSKLKLTNTGSGATLGTELEEAILGMSLGETKEVPFGKDKKMTAKIKVVRVSRYPKKEEGVKNDQDA